MPTIKPAVVRKEIRANGTVNVKIRVCHNRDVRYISTDFYVPPENFDDLTGKVIHSAKSYKGDYRIDVLEAKRINERIQVMIGIMIEKCDKQKNVRFIDTASLMSLLRDNRREYDLLSLIDDRITQYDNIGNKNYKESFERTKRILKDFSGTYIPFEAVDFSFLRRMEIWMRSKKINGTQVGMRTNSIGVHMRNIRTIYNQAITLGLVELSNYPFRKYKIAREITRHRTLTGEEIAKFYRKPVDDPLLAWARDMAMLSFFLIGINMKDLMYLRVIEDGRVNYIRSKGKRPYSILVHPEALEIINRYRGEKFLINTLEKYSYYRNATKRINKKLKDMAVDCGITKPVTTYYMRHSWATIARSLGISKDDISYALGHQRPSLEMTEIYVEEDQETVDTANRIVINHITNIPILNEIGRNESEETFYHI